MKKDEIVDVTIDSLAYGGDGVGKVDGFTVFVEDSAPGDVLKVKITQKKKNYARAEISEILEPSEIRVKPKCEMIKQCGGCNWQHIEYGEQLKAKRQMIEDNLRRIGGVDAPVRDVLPSDNNYNYRCKVQNPVQQGNKSTDLKIGYYKKSSHKLVDIKVCPIQPEYIDEIREFIREKGQELGITAYNKRNKKGLLRHVVFRYSQSDDTVLLVFVVNSSDIPRGFKELSKACMEKFPKIAGTLVNSNVKHNNLIFGPKTFPVEGKRYVEEHLEDKVYRITAGSFFQVNPSAAVKMFNTVKTMISDRVENPAILDVYAGVASFAIWLKDSASTISAIEEYPPAVKDANVNIKLNEHIEGADINMIKGDANEILVDLVKAKERYDVVILDPPRKGCDAAAIESAAKLADKYIIYVSCDPSTLARDLKSLAELGFETEYVQPVDMFCHTYHVESIAVIKKTK